MVTSQVPARQRRAAAALAGTLALTLAIGLASAAGAPLKQGTSAFTAVSAQRASTTDPVDESAPQETGDESTAHAIGGRALKRGYDLARAQSQELLRADFNNLPASASPISPANFQAALGGTKHPDTNQYDDTYITQDDAAHGNVIRTHLDARTIRGSHGPDVNHGVVLYIAITPTDHACMQYDIKFSNGFDFDMGGKLPGLEGVYGTTTPSAPSGGSGPLDYAWSGRMMWIDPDGTTRTQDPSNTAVSYMYHPRQAGANGDNVRWNKTFISGQWHTVKQCYTMNTPGQANGVLEAWFDGVKVVDNHQFVYRNDSTTGRDLHISHIAWEIFRGGDIDEWMSLQSGEIYIDNVVVTGYPNSAPASCTSPAGCAGLS